MNYSGIQPTVKVIPKKNISRPLMYLFSLCFIIFLSCNEFSKEKTFSNPIRDGADPWVFKKGDDYYYCTSSGGGIAISKSSKLTEQGIFQKVWDAPDQGWNSANIWAPEIHYISGHWYIYYTAGEKPGGPFIHQKSGVLKSYGNDPFGPYEDKGMLYTGDDITDPESVKWAIDLTPFEHEGELYAIWSGWEDNRETDRTAQHLYIAKMSDPATISSNRVKISSPEESWETGGELDLNEGPQVLKRNNLTFIIYSTRESWLKEYRMGQLKLKEASVDPLLSENWVKTGPVFMGNETVYGVGHCSFTTSPDGTEYWILYHSKKGTEPGWDRDIRLQPFQWRDDGSPDFGNPVSINEVLPLPSGEKE